MPQYTNENWYNAYNFTATWPIWIRPGWMTGDKASVQKQLDAVKPKKGF